MVPNDKDDSIDEPVLEAPPGIELPAISKMQNLFDEETMASAASKLLGVESFLHLLTRNISFNDFMREVLITLLKVVRSEAGSIFEINHKQNHFFFRATAGSCSDRLPHFTIPLKAGIVGHVAESRQPMVVRDIDENKLHLRSISDSLGFHVKGLVAVPIIIRGKVFGVVELLNRIGDDEFSTADVELLSYLVEQSSKAIEIRLVL